jgi:hypothetical protein
MSIFLPNRRSVVLLTRKPVSALLGYDVDALAYIAAVEGPFGDNQTLETGVRTAINDFVVGCKNDGIWSAIKASCILAGARTLSGALVPLAGTAPTNNNFVSGDYNRKTGLVGDGSTKYLNSNYAFPTDLQNNCHLAGFMSAVDTVGAAVGAYGDAFGNGSLISSRGARLYQDAASTFIPSDTTTTGFRGVSRSSASSYLYSRAGSNETANIASSAVTHEAQGVFARRRNTGSYDAFTDARLAFYSIGESLDIALLDARVTALITAFGAAIP